MYTKYGNQINAGTFIALSSIFSCMEASPLLIPSISLLLVYVLLFARFILSIAIAELNVEEVSDLKDLLK